MENSQLKFRMKVIERNDGTKMYHPQVYVVVGVKSSIFHKPSLEMGWRSLVHKNGEGLYFSFDEKNDGCGASTLENAKTYIEQYKIDVEKRAENRKKLEQEKLNSETKNITYIEI